MCTGVCVGAAASADTDRESDEPILPAAGGESSKWGCRLLDRYCWFLMACVLGERLRSRWARALVASANRALRGGE